MESVPGSATPSGSYLSPDEFRGCRPWALPPANIWQPIRLLTEARWIGFKGARLSDGSVSTASHDLMLPGPVPGSLRERTERGVDAASAWHTVRGVADFPERRETALGEALIHTYSTGVHRDLPFSVRTIPSIFLETLGGLSSYNHDGATTAAAMDTCVHPMSYLPRSPFPAPFTGTDCSSAVRISCAKGPRTYSTSL